MQIRVSILMHFKMLVGIVGLFVIILIFFKDLLFMISENHTQTASLKILFYYLQTY